MRYTYTLTAPMIITSRLEPGITIGSGEYRGTISLEPCDGTDPFAPGRTYSYTIDTSAGALYSAQDLHAHGGIRVALAALLAFLGMDAMSYRATMGKDAPEGGWCFDLATAEWAYMVEDELSLACEELSH